jgi:hypothetical protein
MVLLLGRPMIDQDFARPNRFKVYKTERLAISEHLRSLGSCMRNDVDNDKHEQT